MQAYRKDVEFTKTVRSCVFVRCRINSATSLLNFNNEQLLLTRITFLGCDLWNAFFEPLQLDLYPDLNIAFLDEEVIRSVVDKLHDFPSGNCQREKDFFRENRFGNDSANAPFREIG